MRGNKLELSDLLCEFPDGLVVEWREKKHCFSQILLYCSSLLANSRYTMTMACFPSQMLRWTIVENLPTFPASRNPRQ